MCMYVMVDYDYDVRISDPQNYMSYYRRATVYLAMGKSKSALPDLSRVIELKPDFTSVSSTAHSSQIVTYFNFIQKRRLFMAHPEP